MPFDMTPQVETDKHRIYKRLRVLRELLPKSGSQDTYNTCLWSLARFDDRLIALGISGGPEPTIIDRRLFGYLGEDLFGTACKAAKFTALDNTIKELEEELSTV